jgi:hypothetical protein
MMSFASDFDQRNLVLAKALKEHLSFRPCNKDRAQTPMNQLKMWPISQRVKQPEK